MKLFECRRFAGILLLFALTCGGCQPFSSEQPQKKTAVSIQQLNDPACTIAVSEAGPAYEAVKRDLPKAKRLYLMGQPAYDAVRSGKADAYADGRTPIDVAVANGLSGVKILPDKIGDPIDIAVGISKNSKYPGLKDKINKFIAEMKANGTLQDMYQCWAVDRNFTMPDIPLPEKADTKLVVGTTGLVMPFTYYEGTTLTGYDIELSRRFAQWLGAELEFKVYNFGGILPAAVAGEVDCLMSNLFVTPERKERMDFSDPIYIESVALMVKDDDAVSVSEASEEKGYYSVSELDGKRIGVFTGAVHDQMVKKALPKAECVYFDSIADVVSAVSAGKIDALAADEQIIRALEQENSSVRHIDEYLEAFDNAFIVSKTPEGDKIRTQLNEFIRSLKSDGTLQQILDIWEGTDESRKTLPDYANYPDTNGSIRIAANNTTPPFTYIKDRRLVGYEIDIIARFCKAYGYRPDIESVSFPAIIPGVMYGKYLLGICSFTVTEERKESVNFTEPTYTGGAMLLVRKTPEELKASESNTPSAVQSPAKYTKLADLRGKKIGIQTGTDSWARLVKKLIPDAEVLFFNDITGLATALESGKIDAFLESNVAMAMLTAVKKNITVLDENISEGYSCAVALRRDEKGQKLKAQWDEYITALKKDGKIDALMDKWTGSDESVKTIPDYESLPAPNGVLVMPTDGVYPPLSYYSGNTLKGFELDVAARFCEAYGYGLKIKLMSFPGMLPSIATGKCDFSVAAASVTEEHKETLTLSVPLYTYTTKIAVLASQENTPAPAVKTPDEKHTALAGLNGKRIGVPTGVDEWTAIISKLLPDAEPVYYNTTADLIAALESGKIEAFPCDAPMLDLIMSQNKNIAALDEIFQQSYEAGVAFPKTEKGRRLKAQWDEYITSLKNTGKLEDLVRKWTGADESAKTIPDYESFPAPNGVLITATNGDYPPFNYYSSNKLKGLEIDLAAGFCQAYGYGLKYRVMTYDGILPSVKSGKSDFVLAALSLTEEHAENLLFSIPYYTFTTKIAVLAPKKDTPAPAQNTHSEKDPRLAAFNGKRIGVITGVDEWADIVHKLLPASEVVYYNEWADLAAAMLGGKIAAFACDTPVLALLMQENKNIASLGIIDESIDIAVGFPKSGKFLKLKSQWDEFITALKNTGELDSIINKWTSAENPDKSIPEYKALPAPNGVLEMAADGTNPPFSYYIGNNIAGAEIELAAKFCEAYGYGLKIDVMTYEAVLAALESGKCDFSLADLVPSKEHAENILFSVPYYASATALAVPANSPAAKISAPKPAAPASKAQAAPASPSTNVISPADFAGKEIGVSVGTTGAETAAKVFPDAKIVYFDSRADVITALKQGKIDAICMGYNSERFLTLENEDLAVLGKPLSRVDSAPVFAKTQAGRKLCEQFTEFLTAQRNNGFLDELDSIWFGPDDTKKTAKDYSSLPAVNGVLKMAADTTSSPFVYVKDNKILGYDVDCAVKFCEEYGYGLKIVSMNFGAIIPAVVSGKCDFGLCNISITEERKESILYSAPNILDGDALLVRKADLKPAVKAASAPVKSTPDSSTKAPSSGARLTQIADLAGKKIAVVTGTTHPQIAAKFVPTAELVYFDGVVDSLTALKAGKVDAACTATIFLRNMMAEDDSIAPLGEQLTFMDCAPIFTKTEKGRKLCEQFSKFAKACWDNGTIKELESIWFDSEESKRVMKDYSALPSPNGTLRMAVDVSMPPCVYMKNNRIAGYDVDFAVRFCEAYGYGLEVMPMNFAAIIPALKAGRCDFGIGTITITDERKENMLFSYPNLKAGNIFAVRKEDTLPQSRTGSASLNSLSGKKIGIILGANHDTFAAEKIPDAKIEYFSDLSTITLALRNGKISAFANTLPTAIYMTNAQKDLAYISEPLESTYTYSSFTNSERGRKLCSEYEEFLRTLWADGTIDTLADKWVYSENESARTVEDYSKLPTLNGVLKMAIDTGRMPFAYVKDNRIIGYDIELAAMFCKAKGYGLKVYPMDFAGILGSIKTGKCDLTGSITWTEERAETMLYSSVPNAQTDIVLIVMNTQPPAKKPAPASASGLYTNIQDLAGKRVAVQTGTICDQITTRVVPEAKPVYFDTQTDLVTALKTNKVEAICTDIPIAKYMMSAYDNMTMLGDPLTEEHLAPIFAKTEAGRKLCSKFTEFTKAAWENGTIQELESIWFGKDDSRRVVKDYSKLPAANGILKMAVDPATIPFTYMKGSKIVGYDVDFAVRFCEKYGYGMEIMPMNFAGVIPAVMSGKCDLAISAITVTPERAESVLFSEPHANAGAAFFVRKSDTQSQPVQTSGQYNTLEEIADKRIAVQTGTASALLVEEKLPGAKIQYFDSLADTLVALKAGKVDALASTIFLASHMVNTNNDITILDQWLRTTDISPIFTKSDRGRKLCEEYSEFLKGLWDDGTIDKLNDIWLGPDESRKIIRDYSNLPATNGTIRLAVDSSMPPLAYVRDNRVVGYDIDLAVRFCEAKGYSLKITQGSVPAILAEVMSGKSDFTMSLMYSEERAEKALFPKTPSGHSGNVVVVLKAKTVQTSGRYNSIQELSGKKIGVMTGTTNERLVAENIPTATREYFNTLPDALLALKTGKIDAICCSIYAARYMTIENDDITYLENMLAELDLMPIFSPTDKGRKLRDEYSEFVKGLWDDGTINEIDSVWLGKDDTKRVIKDYSKLPAPNGILRMAAEPTDIPFVYMKDNQFVGYDVDIAVRFCEKYGYGLEVVPMSFSAVISSVNSGKTDFSASMHWNQERAQSALFASTPTAHSGNVIVVMKAKPESYEGEYSTFEELAGKNIGAQTGTPNGDFALKAIPTANIQYFDGFADIVTALKMRKIDAASLALNAARFMLIYNEDLTAMGKPLAELDAAPIFAKTNKGRKLCEQFNKFIKAQWDNGTLQELDSIWFGRDESKRTPKDYASLPAPNGVLKMAVDTSLAPFAYVKDNKIAGYEIDCAVKFCKEYGYGLEVIPMNFAAIIAAVQSGKCDFASCTIAITPERAEQVLFASPNAKTGSVLVVRKAKPQPVSVHINPETPPSSQVQPSSQRKVSSQIQTSSAQTSAFMEDAREFFEELKASFNRTFIREERWRLFIEGIINTMIITVLSILFGTVLGFVVYLFCRGGNVFANLLTRFFIWLIEGTPIVVLLMILYYIIFGKVDIPGIWVAVIAFTMTFGAGFYGMLRSGTGALDRGQTEAAYALGFSDTQTFFTVILPQAALHFMPAYKSSVVALIKSTAIVGYIAVQDLTKMGDIVRSRTYEAFFPLIAVAAIYFVLAGMLNIIVGMIHNRIRPEKRTKDDILKGVDSHD